MIKIFKVLIPLIIGIFFIYLSFETTTEQDRENISYNMSDTMKRQQEQKQLLEEQKEFDRLQRVNLFDETAKEHYDRMNKLMLGR